MRKQWQTRKIEEDYGAQSQILYNAEIIIITSLVAMVRWSSTWTRLIY